MDLFLVKRTNSVKRGELVTYFSVNWTADLIPFRRKYADEDEKQRDESNRTAVANIMGENPDSVKVCPLSGKFVVSAKPDQKSKDLTIYVVELCLVTFSSQPKVVKDGFDLPEPGKVSNSWLDIDTMKNNRPWIVNGDVVRAVYELFRVELDRLPDCCGCE